MTTQTTSDPRTPIEHSETDPSRPLGGLRRWVRTPALPAFVGAIVFWLACWVEAGHGLFGTLTAGALIASFLAIVGIGQLFVITAGGGGIDLSVPFVMTLSAYLACEIMNAQNGTLIAGVCVGLAIGIGAGILNAILVELLGIPPLVGTLALGFVLQSVVLVSSSATTPSPSPALVSFVNGKWLGIPIFAIAVIVAVIVFAVVLKRTGYGRSVEAVGQSSMAGWYSGLSPRRVRSSAYVLCGLLASVAGVFLAAYSGGPSLDMSTSYQLSSIAVVVLGGSLIAGGRGSVPGVWAGALLLTLLLTLVSAAQLSTGVQNILQGALIVLVLTISRKPGSRSRLPRLTRGRTTPATA